MEQALVGIKPTTFLATIRCPSRKGSGVVVPNIPIINGVIQQLVVTDASLTLGTSAGVLLRGLAHPIQLANQDAVLAPIVQPIHVLVENHAGVDTYNDTVSFETALRQVVNGLAPRIEQADDETKRLYSLLQRRWGNATQQSTADPEYEKIVSLLSDVIKPFPHPMGVFELNPAAATPDDMVRLIETNPANDSTSGFEAGYLTSMETISKNVHPTDLARFGEFIMGVVANGVGFIENVRLLKEDGSYLWADIHVATLPFGREGRRIGYYVLFDQTERQRALAEIQRYQELLKNSFQPLSIFVLDETADYELIPRAILSSQSLERLLGYTHDEMIQSPLETFFPEATRPKLKEHIDAFVNTGMFHWRGAEMICKDGSTVQVDIQAHPSLAGDKQYAMVVYTNAGIRVQTEKQLLQVHRAQSFLSVIRDHEHQVSRALLEIIEDLQHKINTLGRQGERRTPQLEITTLEELKHELEQIQTVFNRLPGLTDGSTDGTPLNLHDLLTPEAVPQRIRYAADLTFELDDNPIPIRGPVEEIQQLYFIMLENAYEAIPEGDRGRIWVRTSRRTITTDSLASLEVNLSFSAAQPGEYVKFVVQDSGPGIPRDQWHLLFDPFYTTKPRYSFTAATGHLGLGLTNLRHLVSQRGGFVRVDSRPGKTIFEVYLPILDVTPPKA